MRFETGRFLEPSLIYDYQNKLTKVFNRIIAERGDLIDGYSHYSNEEKDQSLSKEQKESKRLLTLEEMRLIGEKIWEDRKND